MELTELEKHEEITDVSFDHEGAHLASTHMLQGGASSGWNTALILKSDDTDQELIKALEQIEVKLSMEEFLSKFFSMWSDDAELLTKILGFETEAEYTERLVDDGMEAPDRWGTNESWEEYKKRNLETRAEKVKFIAAAQEDGFESLTSVEKVSILEFQSEIEKGVEFLGGFDKLLEKNTSDPENVDAGDAGDLSDGEGVKKAASPAEGKSNENPSADKEINKTSKNKEGKIMTKEVIEKSADELKLEKMVDQMATLEKALEDANTAALEKATKLEALEKAEADRKTAGATKLVKSFSYISEENQEAVVEFMVKSVDAPVIAEVLKQAQDAITTAEAKVEEVKKEFGESEHGHDKAGEVNTAQATLNKSLESFEATLKDMAD